jgi:hypothetical protein
MWIGMQKGPRLGGTFDYRYAQGFDPAQIWV